MVVEGKTTLFGHVVCFVLLALLGAVEGCSGGGGGSSGLTASNPEAGVYAGYVLDADGNPIAGAVVSVEGVEAEAVTGEDGYFAVSDPSLALASLEAEGVVLMAKSGPEAAVLAPGYEPLVAPISPRKGEYAGLELMPRALEAELTVINPSGEELLVIPKGCTSPEVSVEGYARLVARDTYRYDVVLLVDTSGSTGRAAAAGEGAGTVLDVEIAAARCFLEALDSRMTRTAIVRFADDAETLAPFGSDEAALGDALEAVGDPGGGTNLEAAFLKARDLFEELMAEDASEPPEPAEGDGEAEPEPERIVVLLTDGIPTAHGVPRNTADSNLTQSATDRRRAIDAARELGRDVGAKLFAFAIVPEDRTEQKLTTLPHSVAACGGGRFVRIHKATQLEGSLCSRALEEDLSVTLENETSGADAVVAELAPDGFFSANVLLAVEGAKQGEDGVSLVNSLRARIETSSLKLKGTKEVRLEVRFVREEDLEGLADEVVLEVQEAPVPVRELEALPAPAGGQLGDGDLWNFLVGPDAAEFEDAELLPGIETFRTAPGDPGAPTVTLQVDFLFKEACFLSDVGYIVVDPADLPASAEEALEGVGPDSILFSTGDIGAATCDLQSIPQGTARFEVEFPADRAVALFILPNRSLDDYQANPRRGRAPLFTIAHLNPGGFTQTLVFRTQRGRTAAGPDETVVAAGPAVVLAFEDLAIARKRSDQDFSDVVLMISGGLTPRAGTLACGDD